jgi:amino acid adenylation domain-containing protein
MDFVRMIKNIREVIDIRAEIQSHQAFLISPETGRSISFQEIKQNSILISRLLHQAGLERGDKVAFLMDNGLFSAQLFLGAMYGGYVAVPLNVRAGAAQLSFMLDHCDAKVVFVEAQYSGLLAETLGSVRRDVRVIESSLDDPLPAPSADGDAWAPLSPAADDPALLMYSSGSTGTPKGAVHTHSSILAHGRNSIQSHQLTSRDRSLLVLPLYHINAECVTLIPTLLSGGTVVVAHRFVVSKFWDWVENFQVTWSALVPTIISELVDWDDPAKDRRQAAFERIRFFRSSSAPLSPLLHQQFLDKFNLPLIQAMGSTEGGNIFSNPVPPGENKIGSPGLPWGFEARIVDRQGADVPRGEAGEVLLRGPGMMKGYYKDAEGTAAVLDSEGWLHTGDLARQDEDGYFFVVGRSKELIIKGGVNIAPRQIDEVLESHPAVLEAAAVGVPDRYFGEDAVAFVVLRQDTAANENELLAFCESRLGHFKAPSRIHFLKELPKGPSGKVQRLRLLDPDVLSMVAATAQPQSAAVTSNGNGHRSSNGLPSASGSIEQIIAAAWAEVLAVPQVDLEKNFFALGGHSLLAIQCLSKLREKLPVLLSLADFFAFNTVAEQAELVRQRLRAANGTNSHHPAEPSTNWEEALLQQYVPPVEEVIPHFDSSLPRPLSPAQQRLWFTEQLNPQVPVYNEAEAVLLTGELNVAALERAMNEIVARHELLRSTIKVIDSVPHAVVHESWPLRFRKIDLSALPPQKRQSEVDRLLIDEPRVPYDLESEPGIRVALLHLSPREHVFILMMHHIVCDWSSEGIIWRELSALYGSHLKGAPAVLPALPVTHGDYAAWQQQRLATNSFAEDLTFWEETLSGAPALLELPADRPRPPMMSYQGGRLRWKLSSELTEALRDMSRLEKTSLFTIFAAALNTLLYRYTGTEDILLGIPLADRDQRELQSVVGFLLHVHVLRTRLSGDMKFRDLLGHVQKGVLDLYAHRSVPFDQIVRKLQPERNLSHSPLFQVMLNWRDRDQQLSFIGLEGLVVESLMASSNTSKFDLYFFVTDVGEEILVELEYSSALFDEDRMRRMLGHYEALLETVAGDRSAQIAAMPLLTADEHRQIVYEWNRTELSSSCDKCLDQLIHEQIERTPDALAVDFEGDHLTYRQLGERAGELAACLRNAGVGRNTLVALCTERSLDMVVGLLGILKAGGAYLPIDPTFPSDRVAFMLQDAQPLVLVTQQRLLTLFPSQQDKVVCLDDLPASPNPQPIDLAGREAEDRAYVLYTSGSTGTPKGVQISHRALVNFLASMQREPGIGADDILLAITTLSFDIAGLEIFLPLTVGARVIIASSEAARDGSRLSARMKSCGATIMQATPATWRMLLDSGWKGSPGLKILCGGEAWGAELSTELLPRCKSLWNMYGPTETTIWSSASRVERDKPVQIGFPIANTTFHVLDKNGQLLPVGIPGELHIGGRGLALGYLWRDDLTRDRFIDDPYSRQNGARLYRTGDLVRRAKGGAIEFIRRVDHQVKIRGFRIELGEIEASLEQLAGINRCVVIVVGNNSADKRLVAYLVPSDPRRVPGIEELRGSLKRRLPDYMIPSAFAVVEKIPLTPNGKIDREALSRATATTIAHEAMGDVPRDSVELKLLEIWEQLLDARPLGIRANFFDVGGYSLLAIRLFDRINRIFDRSLPISSIFGSPTIEQLATLVRGRPVDAPATPVRQSRNAADKHSSITPIQPHGSGAPLFLVHGRGGYTIVFYRLAMEVRADRPVYGIQAQSLLPGEPALLRLEDQASYYVSEIRKIQPQGPYFLLGYSFGGTVAFEIAQQLHALGQRVEMLGMLDTRRRDFVGSQGECGTVSKLDSTFARHFRVIFGPRSLKEKNEYLWERIVPRVMTSFYSTLLRVGFRSVPSLFKNTFYITRVAELMYKPRSWHGSVTLFRATVQPDPKSPHDLGWAPLAKGGVDVWEVPGDHLEVHRGATAQVEALAERLRERLERSDSAATELRQPACSAS